MLNYNLIRYLREEYFKCISDLSIFIRLVPNGGSSLDYDQVSEPQKDDFKLHFDINDIIIQILFVVIVRFLEIKH